MSTSPGSTSRRDERTVAKPKTEVEAERPKPLSPEKWSPESSRGQLSAVLSRLLEGAPLRPIDVDLSALEPMLQSAPPALRGIAMNQLRQFDPKEALRSTLDGILENMTDEDAEWVLEGYKLEEVLADDDAGTAEPARAD